MNFDQHSPYQQILTQDQIGSCLKKFKLPQKHSHKGQNGKLLIIGGSNLFHVASRWSLTVASKIVDIVFYSSVPINNQIIKQSKTHFNNGIVVPRHDLSDYIQEADCILIGPGMDRDSDPNQALPWPELKSQVDNIHHDDWENNTKKIVNYLLLHYPKKKWVIDAGALQMVHPQLITNQCLLTPHQGEFQYLVNKLKSLKLIDESNLKNLSDQEFDQLISTKLNSSLILKKGELDTIIQHPDMWCQITGGNEGMIKGGTGDTLAGLTAALYCLHDIRTTAIISSYINKKAGDSLYNKVGPFYNASDLVQQVPITLWQEINKAKSS